MWETKLCFGTLISMKSIQCQHCTAVLHAKNKEDMLNQMYSHYMKEHESIITSVDEAGKKAWMEKFEADWSAAEAKENN